MLDAEHTARTHRCASNASNHASNGRSEAGDSQGSLVDPGYGTSEERVVLGAPGAAVGVGRKQRWARDKYNAYQREYMRKRRAKDKDQVSRPD